MLSAQGVPVQWEDIFFLHGVQTSSASYPASHPSGTKSDVLSGKADIEWSLTTHLHLDSWLRMCGTIPPGTRMSSRRTA